MLQWRGSASGQRRFRADGEWSGRRAGSVRLSAGVTGWPWWHHLCAAGRQQLWHDEEPHTAQVMTQWWKYCLTFTFFTLTYILCHQTLGILFGTRRCRGLASAGTCNFSTNSFKFLMEEIMRGAQDFIFASVFLQYGGFSPKFCIFDESYPTRIRFFLAAKNLGDNCPPPLPCLDTTAGAHCHIA